MRGALGKVGQYLLGLWVALSVNFLLPRVMPGSPLPYLVGLGAAVGVVAWAAARRRPAVTTGRVLSFAPWMVVGSAVHVLYAADALPDAVRPLGGTPAVYVTVGTVGVGAWVLADAVLGESTVARALAASGGVLALGAVALVVVRCSGLGALFTRVRRSSHTFSRVERRLPSP